MLKNRRFTTLQLILLLLVIVGCGDDTHTVYRETQTIQIGALIPLSGDAVNNGEPMLAALQIAEDEFNLKLQAADSDKRVQLIYADTRSNKEASDILLDSFLTQGIRCIIGPVLSEELNYIENTINDSDSLLISPSSTLASLAVEDDNIYRFVPSDIHMAEAIVEVLWHEGIRSLALLYREDAWGSDLAERITDGFTNKGGTIIGSEGYTTLRTSAIEDALAALSDLVAAELESVDASSIGFQLICLSEGDGIMESAASYSTLRQVNWFGADGFVQIEIDQFSEEAAQFALDTKYTASILGVELTAKGEELKTEIESSIGSTINVYPLLSYDAFMVSAGALVAAGDASSLPELRSSFLNELESYEGAVGSIALDDAGDNASGDYYFWRFVQEKGEYLWSHTLTYSDGQVVF